MRCFCENKETYDLKVEGDVDTDPIWCNQCGCNFDIDEVPISDDLKEELSPSSSARMYARLDF